MKPNVRDETKHWLGLGKGHSLPLILYHGTRGSLNLRDSILNNGIRPREHGSGNWPGLVSSPGRVYFSAYAPLVYATLEERSGLGWIFKVELPDDYCESQAFGPDEDCIASFIGRNEGWWNPLSSDPAIHSRMLTLIRNIDPANYSSKWREYLARSGNVSLLGVLEPEYITQYTRVDVDNIPEVLEIYREFNQRKLPGDRATGQAVPSARDTVQAIFRALTLSIMEGVSFTRIDDLYLPDAPDRERKIEKFQRQLRNGFRRVSVLPKK